MKGRPFNDHGRRPIRELPFQKEARINPNPRLIPGIDGMEVWRIMIVEIHANHDAEETADFWHWPPSHNVLSSPAGSHGPGKPGCRGFLFTGPGGPGTCGTSRRR